MSIDNGIIANDHAIFNIIPDLKIYWPNAEILPILIGQKFPESKLDPLIIQLNNICLSDCLLVASVDFSHYLPATLAEVHDAYTIDKLQNLDSLSISYAEVDSPQSLYILTKFAKLKNSPKFNLFAHTNSGYLSRNPDTETTTHVFGSYSRGLLSPLNTNTSMSIPSQMDRSQNQSTVGDRFFYGVDQITIDPTISFVISTIKSPKQTIKSFLPIKDNLFIRDSEKQLLIKNYFDSIPDSKSLTKDYFYGKLNYERR